jgi:SAM-dependent methyltransferase
MPLITLKMPFYLPQWLYRPLKRLQFTLRPPEPAEAQDTAPEPPAINIMGEREIEWTWIAAHLPQGPGQVLDFGSGGSILSLLAAMAGYQVTSVDLGEVRWNFWHPDIDFRQGDILELPLAEASFDVVINCSTVEHVGLVGRYGVINDRPKGDLEAMARLRRLLKPEGTMLLTVPVGRDFIASPLHRIYGSRRLPLLLQGYVVEQAKYWQKNQENQWVPCAGELEALDLEIRVDYENLANNLYGLGCFVLRRGS